MYKVSDKFREQAYSGESLYTANLTINGIQVPVSQISKIVIKDPIIDTRVQTFYIGTFISKQITITFKNISELDETIIENIKSGMEVYLEIGQLIDGEYENVPIGYFQIDDLSDDYYEKNEITCLDYAVKFKPNIDYSPSFDEEGTATIDEILQYICNYFGVTLGEYPDINGDIEIGTYDSTLSGKQYISYIAEIKGSNAKIDRDGVLNLIPFTNVPSVTIDALKSSNWEIGEEYKISRVVYYDAIRNYTYGDDTANTLYIRQDNPFIANENVVENIYENTIAVNKRYKGTTLNFDIDEDYDISSGVLTIYGNANDEITGYNLVYTDSEETTFNAIYNDDNNLIYQIKPSKKKPIAVQTVTGTITIVNRSETTDETDEDYHYDTYTLDLGDIELLKYGNIQDKIYLQNNAWYYTNYFTKIESYSGETIDTEFYLSSTGGLDEGATIYYYNKDNTPLEIPTEELYEQLNALRSMTLYNGTNIIESTIESGIEPM